MTGVPQRGACRLGGPSSATTTTVEYTRPVHPYPQRVAGTGTDDVDDAADYAPVTPLPTDDHYAWAGSLSADGGDQEARHSPGIDAACALCPRGGRP
jgi:hypothetical protein